MKVFCKPWVRKEHFSIIGIYSACSTQEVNICILLMDPQLTRLWIRIRCFFLGFLVAFEDDRLWSFWQHPLAFSRSWFGADSMLFNSQNVFILHNYGVIVIYEDRFSGLACLQLHVLLLRLEYLLDWEVGRVSKDKSFALLIVAAIVGISWPQASMVRDIACN